MRRWPAAIQGALPALNGLVFSNARIKDGRSGLEPVIVRSIEMAVVTGVPGLSPVFWPIQPGYDARFF